MEDDYRLLTTAADVYEAELIRGLLLENDIEVHVLNKKDSELLIGEVELYVPGDQLAAAREILNQHDEE
ncbi:MAG: DUF2007 domain-containing protein [Bacteroidales bacterium]|jgi:type III secretory pathway lipoprotein EscJ|nr:DUF2007 domain-containing protein [Bacteroidales bacterium]MDD3664791.1 DUF2007 domain-containing protein [Bacteroidales bacterium]